MLARRLRIGDGAAGAHGTLLTLSVPVGSRSRARGGVIAIAVAVSAVMSWIAHVHAGPVARRARAGTRLRRQPRPAGGSCC